MTEERRRGALTERVIERRIWGAAPFFLLDVGCSGGLDDRWQAFGDRLRAIGFDPLIAEVDRLNAENTHPGVRYEAAFVTCRNYDELFPPALRSDRVRSKNDDPFPRSSAVAAGRRLETSYVQSVFNKGAPVVVSARSIALDDYVVPGERRQVDFLKIDTDGHDIEVILGAYGIMSAGGIIGLYVESQFHGARHEYANTFSNLDRLLRRNGFTLFDLSAYRYSRAELPAPFVWDIPAQTTVGQVLWGDAVYFRDLGSLEYERMWPGYDVTAERVMKLACLFDLFDLPDCAAELLVNRGQFLAGGQRGELLDALVSGAPGSYAAHVASFEADFTSFFPSRRQCEEPAVALPGDTATVRRVQERATKLKAKNVKLRERLKAQGAKLDKLRSRVSHLQERR